VGLIAREIEARGIPTLSLSSARSITAAVNPPRAVYLDYPLGHTAGKRDDNADQMAVMRDALAAFSSIRTAGTIIDLPYVWRADDSWKDSVMRPSPVSEGTEENDNTHADDRVERFDTPQYQHPSDVEMLEPACPSCIFLEASA